MQKAISLQTTNRLDCTIKLNPQTATRGETTGEKKGKSITYVEDKIIQGDNAGNYRDKAVRENVLMDVLDLRNQGKTKGEIHEFGCDKYNFREDNPWENRYFKHIEENKL